MVKRLSFFEEIPSVQRTPDQLVEDIDNLARRIYRQMEDPQGLSHTILELSVKNMGLGHYLVEALDLSREAETGYKYNVEKTKLAYIKSGDSATAAESKAKVEHKERLDEWNQLQRSSDLIKIKRQDCDRVIDAARSRLSLIKSDMVRS